MRSLLRRFLISVLRGEWRVYKSGFLQEPEGVQAYSTEQLRALVGTRLQFGRMSVKWDISHWQPVLKEHADSFTDRCVKPTVQDKRGRRFNIRCSDGSVFGPGGDQPDFLVLENGNLKVEWYDNVVLYLRKQK